MIFLTLSLLVVSSHIDFPVIDKVDYSQVFVLTWSTMMAVVSSFRINL